jgi:hypothetical protein
MALGWGKTPGHREFYGLDRQAGLLVVLWLDPDGREPDACQLGHQRPAQFGDFDQDLVDLVRARVCDRSLSQGRKIEPATQWLHY